MWVTHEAGGTEPLPAWHMHQSGSQAVHVEGLVALITQQQLLIVALLAADLALL